jgi:hypothetical protein
MRVIIHIDNKLFLVSKFAFSRDNREQAVIFNVKDNLLKGDAPLVKQPFIFFNIPRIIHPVQNISQCVCLVNFLILNYNRTRRTLLLCFGALETKLFGHVFSSESRVIPAFFREAKTFCFSLRGIMYL